MSRPIACTQSPCTVQEYVATRRRGSSKVVVKRSPISTSTRARDQSARHVSGSQRGMCVRAGMASSAAPASTTFAGGVRAPFARGGELQLCGL